MEKLRSFISVEKDRGPVVAGRRPALYVDGKASWSELAVWCGRRRGSLWLPYIPVHVCRRICQHNFFIFTFVSLYLVGK